MDLTTSPCIFARARGSLGALHKSMQRHTKKVANCDKCHGAMNTMLAKAVDDIGATCGLTSEDIRVGSLSQNRNIAAAQASGTGHPRATSV